MPTTAPRKSSLNLSGIAGRRGGAQKKYIPYRADDLQHGKRTGLAVGPVERDSDGFEPFEKLMGQADLRTPPRARGPARRRQQSTKKKGKEAAAQQQQEVDEEEEDMDIDSECLGHVLWLSWT